MNKAMILFAGAVAALSLAGPVFADSASPATKEPAKETSSAAAKPATHKIAGMRHVTGEVVSVNEEAKTLTVKQGPKGKELTFAVEADATAHLSGLKAGDQVKIGYVKGHKQLMARDIVRSEMAKAK